ncbi:DNA topoisomerase 6 subunit B [Tanacetum coccineum]
MEVVSLLFMEAVSLVGVCVVQVVKVRKYVENRVCLSDYQPRKYLYTTVRELVENSLDSSESIAELPFVEVTIEEINKSKFNSMIGLIDHERIDEALYGDFETDKAREVRTLLMLIFNMNLTYGGVDIISTLLLLLM